MERDHDKKSREKSIKKLIQSNLVLYYSIRINVKIFILKKKRFKKLIFSYHNGARKSYTRHKYNKHCLPHKFLLKRKKKKPKSFFITISSDHFYLLAHKSQALFHLIIKVARYAPT